MEDISNVSSISAAAAAYQAAMAMQGGAAVKTEAGPNGNEVAMNLDLPPAQAIAAAPAVSSTPTPAPRTGTPARMTNGDTTPRASSQHPEPTSAFPVQAAPHGAVSRQYLNEKVAGPLKEGMKILARDQPSDPLRVLGEYLLQKSKELEQ